MDDTVLNSAQQMELQLKEAPKIESIEIISLLGRGSSSSVYKAKQLTMDRLVALKVLPRTKASDDAAMSRFQQEARIASKLEHPNIARTLAFGLAEDGSPYHILELLEGITLEEEIKRNAPLKFGRFKEIFLPLLSALHYAHESGLVHRDIKPANIIITSKGDIKLLDFGIASVFDEKQLLLEKGKTISVNSAGSPAYMSPEQCLGKAVDRRSDLYSLACVMYETLCAEPPFLDESPLALMQKHTTARLPSTVELVRQMEMPPALAKVILKALSKNPDRRQANAKIMDSELNRALDEITLDRSPRKATVEKKSKRAPFRIIAPAGILLLCAACWCFAGLQDKHHTAEKELRSLLGSDPSSMNITQLENLSFSLEMEHKFKESLPLRELLIHKRSKSASKQDLANAYSNAAGDCLALAHESTDSEVSAAYMKSARQYTERAMALVGYVHDQEMLTNLMKHRCQLGAYENKPDAGKRLSSLLLDMSKRLPAYRQAESLLICAEILGQSGLNDGRQKLLSFILSMPQDSNEIQEIKLRALLELASMKLARKEVEESLLLCAKASERLLKNRGIEAPGRRNIIVSMSGVMMTHRPDLLRKTILADLEENGDRYKQDRNLSTVQLILGESYQKDGFLDDACRCFKLSLKTLDSLAVNPSLSAGEFLMYKESKKMVLEALIRLKRSQNKNAELRHYEEMLRSLN